MLFSGLGPSKYLVFCKDYVGFWAGEPKSAFWEQKCTFGRQNVTMGGNPSFLRNGRAGLKNGRAALKKDQESIGLRKGSGKREMVKFREFPTFCDKIQNSI